MADDKKPEIPPHLTAFLAKDPTIYRASHIKAGPDGDIPLIIPAGLPPEVVEMLTTIQRQQQEIDRLRSQGSVPVNAAAIAQSVAVRVAGLPDRTSPDDWPEAMLVTGEELHLIVMDEIFEATLSAAPQPVIHGMEPLGSDFAAVWDANIDKLYDGQPPLSAGEATEHQSGAEIHGEPDSRAPKSVNSHGKGGHSGSPTPPVDGLREALVDCLHALQALLNAVKTNPAMQDRKFIPIGIQVNNAIDKARAALASTPARIVAGCQFCTMPNGRHDDACPYDTPAPVGTADPLPAGWQPQQGSVEHLIVLSMSDGEYLGRHATAMEPKEWRDTKNRTLSLRVGQASKVHQSALDAAVASERAKWEGEVAEISNRLRAVERIQGLVRADELKQCEVIANNAAVDLEALRAFDGDVHKIGAYQDACNYIAAAIRARGQGGAE